MVRRDEQFAGLLTSTGLAMKRHRAENKFIVVSSGLQVLRQALARWASADALRVVQVWWSQTNVENLRPATRI